MQDIHVASAPRACFSMTASLFGGVAYVVAENVAPARRDEVCVNRQDISL